ncbi:hypothetical protein A2574_03710 [Candidatus Shapirobacteria bacterium RIFOXYD1_FULL_38_32]|uniref:Hydrolase TatD n=2 Tax=Candidatus Shapironibacteriota TaxID=1752721 RepID=A0A1F7SPV4_9BACT|nr:MAG: Hydrolase, TatD family [Candidatus Shapirobacteria bacterium GW2011_GWE1_38_92]OGL55708.1 MAG: hypothetical protein A2195_02325 [Candidatus Shapirobacteria bacterium RIFOXYA1_FULL_39_17]OGL55822.1 MAG: hypothetical protein A2367_02615 [Candidatus Shapirobacteria bacterium RIFOXYB1_FULL_38_38]OGL56143.1 MAG: hypothetical protein A2410_02835 [Candidatus Shapirobacteria bacterium RIFOXYC1_FULL_38_24]OGL58064.1 MAG: hypothetical protein A2574_03710 [Candidatus Shapirobacteria bacterium RIFO
MIDTHAHIRKGEEIRIEGLDWVVLSGPNMAESKDNVEIAKMNPKLRAAVGIHPQELDSGNIDKNINELDKILDENPDIVAVGECGLDFSENPLKSPFDKRDFQEMERLFRGQIALSLKHKKPLIVHSRKAMEETLEILGSYKNLRGVIHCYSGGKKRVQKVLDLPGEWYFGIDGNLTYEDGLAEVVKLIPKDRLLLETDSPELTPLPFRGEKNYPEYVKYIYQKVAKIWQMSLKETEKIIDENAKKLFGV